MIVEIILGITTLTLGFTTYNQMRKVERLETWVENYSARIIQTKRRLDELDSEGKFESDDEIGTVFEGIQDAVNDLTTITDRRYNAKKSKKVHQDIILIKVQRMQSSVIIRNKDLL